MKKNSFLDSQEDQKERIEMILSATINGKSKFLESLAQNHKTKENCYQIFT